jgi:hypothetical protein
MIWKKRSFILRDPNFLRHSASLNATTMTMLTLQRQPISPSQVSTFIYIWAKVYMRDRTKSEGRAILVGVRVSSFSWLGCAFASCREWRKQYVKSKHKSAASNQDRGATPICGEEHGQRGNKLTATAIITFRRTEELVEITKLTIQRHASNVIFRLKNRHFEGV